MLTSDQIEAAAARLDEAGRTRGGERVAAGVLNHPANGAAWLANRLYPHGVALEPGQVILSGSFIRTIEAGRGDTFHADRGPFGTASCHFA